VSLFAYYMEKLKATPDGDGSLLDHSMIMLGSGMGNPDVHNHITCRSSSSAAEREDEGGAPH